MNQRQRRRSKSNVYCCVPKCNTYYSANVSFHKFPSDNTLKSEWSHILNIEKPVSKYMKICSKHFRDEDFFFNRRHVNRNYRLKRNVVPSKNLPNDAPEKKDNKLNSSTLMETMFIKIEKDEEVPEMINIMVDHTYAMGTAKALVNLPNVDKRTEIKEFVDKTVQVHKFDVSDLINTDRKLRKLTGITNFALLDFLVYTLSQVMTVGSQLSIKKMILLSLMHLKLDISFSSLGTLFNVSQTTAQIYFHRVIKKLASCLKHWIRFPSKEDIIDNASPCFKNFSNAVIVLDFMEFKVEHKSKSRRWSLRNKHTVKCLIGAAPSGLVIFLGKAYDGKVSDETIFDEEHLFLKLDSGDAIIVDNGFLIDKECAQFGIELIGPSFFKKRTLEVPEIAKFRVHVERIIQTIRKFRVCRGVIPSRLLKNVNSIFTVIVALTNLSRSILSINK